MAKRYFFPVFLPAIAAIIALGPIMAAHPAHAASTENGVWDWTTVSSQTPTAIRQTVQSAAANKFNAIYLSVDDYLPINAMPVGAAKQKALQAYEKKLDVFLTAATNKHVSVDAETGDSGWANPGTGQPAYDVMNFVAAYNRSHSLKFRGIQYDIEPYTLPQYNTDPGTVLVNYAKLAEGLVANDKTSGLPLSFVIPFFYDGAAKATPQITMDGITAYPYETLLRIFNTLQNGRLIIMAYRNFAIGSGGTVDLSQTEVKEADATNVKVLIAQETGAVSPAYVTFFGTSKNTFAGQSALIAQAFALDKSFGGIAVNDLATYAAL